MTRGIILFGSSGSGKTTLGRKLAQELGYPYFDIDDYLWRKDTPIPFTRMYSRQEKAERLMHDISQFDHFVMAGSMDSFNAPFVPLFDLAVHVDADGNGKLLENGFCPAATCLILINVFWRIQIVMKQTDPPAAAGIWSGLPVCPAVSFILTAADL